MFNQLKKQFHHFIDNNKKYPLLLAIASGLPPMLHYYNRNFWQVNSLNQLTYFIILFIGLPIIVMLLANYVFKWLKRISKFHTTALLCLNVFFFGQLTLFSTIGLGKKRALLICFLAVIISFLFKKYYKKIVVFQLLLALILFIDFMPHLFDSIFYSDAWMKLEDDIESVKFKKKPNIYLIQPDGYANFSELKKENYNFDNTEFETFLTNSGFKLYQNFRSNYYSTLSSNASLFSMKHHYYNNPKKYSNELAKSREIIAGENPVISIFKKNNYKTFLMLQFPYLILNRPRIEYDYCNISFDEIPYISNGFNLSKEITEEIGDVISDNGLSSNFFFIEQITPGHIPNTLKRSQGKEEERIKYHAALGRANNWLKKIISIITKKDNEAIIIIAADHGGSVGLTHLGQNESKNISDTQVLSTFTAALAIKWPKNHIPAYDDKLKSTVNIFRILFAYLSENEKYLQALESNESYTIIKKGDAFGAYQRINDSGDVEYKRKK